MLGRRNQAVDRDQFPVRVTHAQQYLEIQRVKRSRQRHDGLHLDEQAFDGIAARQAFDQADFSLVLQEGRSVELIDDQPPVLPALGFPAGVVGGRDGVFHVRARGNLDQADGATHMEGLVTNLEGIAVDAVDDAAADHGGQGHLDVGQQDHELITANAPHAHATGQHSCHTFADLTENFVTRVMAIQVIDELETVQVQIGHGQGMVLLQLMHCLVEYILDAAAIEHFGQ